MYLYIRVHVPTRTCTSAQHTTRLQRGTGEELRRVLSHASLYMYIYDIYTIYAYIPTSICSMYIYIYTIYIYIYTQPRERRRHESSCITQCTLPTQRKRLGSCIYVYNIYCNICMYAYRYVVRICEQCENAFKTISYSTKTPWSNYICMYFIYAYTYVIYICEQCANIFTTIRYRYSTQRLASSTYI